MNEENMVNSEKEVLLKVEAKGPTDSVYGGGATITVVLIFSIFTAVCGSFTFGFSWGYTSPVESKIIADLKLSTADFSLFASILTVGGLIGALVCGKLTDLMGRRGTMALSAILILVGWFAIAFSQHVWSLDLGRFILGFAGSLSGYAIPVYISEITPRNLRGGAVLLHQLMVSCGIASAFIIGLVTNWRILALIGTVTCLAQLLGLLIIPESPRWLVMFSDDYKYFEASLRRFRGKKKDISFEAAEIKEHAKVSENVSEDHFLSVFQRKYVYALTISLGLVALAALGGSSGFVFYATTIFESAGFSGIIGTVAMALIQLPPTFVGVFLMDKYGRRPILLFSAVGMSTACLSLGVSFLMKELGWMQEFSPYLALFGVLTSAATYPVGLGGIPNLILSEIFPMNTKGAAGSLATVIGFLSNWLVSYTFNFLMNWSSFGTFFIYASINIFAVLFIYKLVPETKGRTLEEIQDSLTSSSYY